MRLPWPRTRPATTSPQLRSAERILARYRAEGATPDAAAAASLAQVRGLVREVEDPARWAALQELVARTGDPWNADDWPLGFDPLVCCVPLCTHVDWECARCPVGQRQDGKSCAHPTSAFGRIGELVRTGDRDGLLAHLRALQRMLADLR